MVKRPLGLNKSNKSKKQKVELPADNEGEQKPQIELDVDPEDELGQIQALYDTYLKGDNKQGGQKILYGVVNESDAVLRAAAEKKEDDKLPARFHNIYALALLGLSKYADLDSTDEGSEQYINTALDRVDVGLSHEPKDSDLLFTKAKALISWAEVKMRICSLKSGNMYKQASEVVKTVDQAIELYEQAETTTTEDATLDQLDVVADLLELAEGFGELEEEHGKGKLEGLEVKYREWTKKRWERVVKDKKPDGPVARRAYRGIGEYYLAQANEFLPTQDEDEDEDDNEDSELTENDKKAKELLQKALDYLVKAEHDEDSEGTIYPIVAEAQIELANLLENESKEQTSMYNEAAKRLKKAQRMGLGDYSEQIEELVGN